MPSTTNIDRKRDVFGILTAISAKHLAELFKKLPTISVARSALAASAFNCSWFSVISSKLLTISSGTSVVPLKNPLDMRVVKRSVALADDNKIIVSATRELSL